MNTNTAQDGGPAFPIPMLPGETWDTDNLGSPNGLSVRDWFAGMALQAIISKTETAEVDVDETEHEEMSARGAYGYADAMLTARNTNVSKT